MLHLASPVQLLLKEVQGELVPLLQQPEVGEILSRDICTPDNYTEEVAQDKDHKQN